MQPSLVPIPIRSSNRTPLSRLASLSPDLWIRGFFNGSLARLLEITGGQISRKQKLRSAALY